jgi:hypothetical protein
MSTGPEVVVGRDKELLRILESELPPHEAQQLLEYTTKRKRTHRAAEKLAKITKELNERPAK